MPVADKPDTLTSERIHTHLRSGEELLLTASSDVAKDGAFGRHWVVITDQRVFKRISVGGAVRWEGKGAIGYYGVQQLPANITELDVDRPIYDQGHYYVDVLMSYRTRLWSDKIGATFQLNVRNIQEGGRLQPINAGPDGEPNSYRIVAPRQFILSATFDL